MASSRSYTNRVILSKKPRAEAPGFTISTFAKATQEKFLKAYYEKYPEVEPSASHMRPVSEEVFESPGDYSDHKHHHRVFFDAVRTRKPVVENTTFGFRAAGPALLANVSYFENRVLNWDPKTMKIVS